MSGLGHIKRGAEKWASDLSYSLQKHNVDVTLFKGGGVVESKMERVIPCIKRNSIILGGKNSRISWYKRADIEEKSFAVFLLPYILSGNFDIWHIGSLYFPFRYLKSMGLINQKLILTCHAHIDLQTVPNWLNVITQPAPFYIENAQKTGVDIKKLFLLPNFVDTRKFNPKVKPIRDELGIPADCVVVLSVGAITKRKRVDYLIEEFAKISKKENAFLLVVGEEEDETPWIKSLGEKLVGDRIKFFSVPFEKMPQVYASSDIFVLTNTDEYFGIVFLEAMSSGKPAIGMAHPATKWIIGEGGENIDMNIEGNVATVLRKYINDASLREKKGRLARARVEELFSLEKVVETTIDLYKRILDN